MKMKLEMYKEIVAKLHEQDKEVNVKGKKRKEEQWRPSLLASKYPNVPEKTLGSIISQEYQRKMKKMHHKHHSPETMKLYYDKYMEMCKYTEQPGCALQLANESDLAPSLMARILIEQHLVICSPNAPPTKTQIANFIKNTCLIDDRRLSTEIYLCILNDDQYGPLTDAIRHSIGQQYEHQLKSHLQELDIPFLAEEQLRAEGYDKTPDVKLEIPISVNGRIVNWIESKASFGDEVNHQIYLKEQFWSYWNRFGPGLVIYWFGYIDELDVNADKGILLRDNFPTDVTFMDPSRLRHTEHAQ